MDRIRDGVFSECVGLTNIALPNSIQTIENVAFADCVGLRSFTIPNSVTYIDTYAFADCTGLANIDVSKNVTYLGFGAFNGCTGLSAINVDPLNTTYCSMDGVLFNKNQTVLIQFPPGKSGSYVILNSVTNISDYGFYDCAGLTSVTIPESVTSVGLETFYGCDSLTAAYFLGLPPNAIRLFRNSASAAVYYLPGIVGWGSTFQGRPAMPWMPSVDLTGAGFAAPTQFSFPITWGRGGSVVIEACVDLANPVWTPVATNILVNGTSNFSEPQSANSDARFYRLHPSK